MKNSHFKLFIMSFDKNDILMLEKIEAYLQGELPADERKAFEQQIKADPELAREVEITRAVNFSIEHKNLKNLKDDLVNTNDLIANIRERVQVNYEATENVAPSGKEGIMSKIDRILQMLFPSPVGRLAMAVAVIVVLLIPTYIFFLQSPDPQQLYADNFEPYPNIITASTRSDVQQAGELDEAMKLYENREYANAINGFNTYINQYPDQYEVRLYRGIANMQMDSINLAIKDLEAVMENNRKLTDQAQWYLALLYLKDGDVAEARKILKQIAESENIFNEKAQNILNKIK